MMSGEAGGAGDALTLNVDLQTQADILKSDTLALRVIKDLHLEDDSDFKPRFNIIGWAIGLITPQGMPDPANASLEMSPRRRERALKVFQSNLKVQVTAGTRLLKISFTSHDPKLAAAVVNDLIRALGEFSFQTRYATTSEVAQWLEKQLGDMRKETESLQQQAVKLQENADVFGLGGVDAQGKTILYSPVLDQLEQSTSELSQAELNRILKQAIFEVAKSGNPEMISQLSGTSLAQSNPGVASSLSLLQQLQAQETTLASQVQQDASQFGASYPRLIEEKAALKSVQSSIHQEVQRIYERAKNDAEIAQKTETGALQTYNVKRQQARQLNNKSIEYRILSKEADEEDSLYQQLLTRLREAGILESLHSSNIITVDQATPSARPSKPKVLVYLIAGLFGGLVLGYAGVILAETIDNKISFAEQIEAMGFTVLGIIPKTDVLQQGGLRLSAQDPHSIFNEAIRAFRSTLLISRTGRPPQVILVTSALPGDGKSTISANLALSLAQIDKKILLVEADLRRPVLALRLGLTGTVGLSHLLAGQRTDEPIAPLAEVSNLYVLPAGPTPPYPTEMIYSQQMRDLLAKWKAEYDFIVIDSPPVLPVADSHLLEEIVDTTALVVKAGKTSRISLTRAYSLLALHTTEQQKHSIGILLNGVSSGSAAYYGYYGYYGGRKYQYDAKDDSKNDTRKE